MKHIKIILKGFLKLLLAIFAFGALFMPLMIFFPKGDTPNWFFNLSIFYAIIDVGFVCYLIGND